MSVCLSVCLSVPKDLANRWTNIVLLYNGNGKFYKYFGSLGLGQQIVNQITHSIDKNFWLQIIVSNSQTYLFLNLLKYMKNIFVRFLISQSILFQNIFANFQFFLWCIFCDQKNKVILLYLRLFDILYFSKINRIFYKVPLQIF